MKNNSNKEKIINAALDVISELGLGGLTFRAVAKQADVNLGLTSYYFKTKEDLLFQAFESFYTQTEIPINKLYEETAAVFKNKKPIEELSEIQINNVAKKLALLLTNYVESQVTKDARYRKIAAAFMHAAIVDPQIQSCVSERQNQFITIGTKWFGHMSLKEPDRVANLFIALISYLERQSMISVDDGFDRDYVYENVLYFFKMILKR